MILEEGEFVNPPVNCTRPAHFGFCCPPFCSVVQAWSHPGFLLSLFEAGELCGWWRKTGWKGICLDVVVKADAESADYQTVTDKTNKAQGFCFVVCLWCVRQDMCLEQKASAGQQAALVGPGCRHGSVPQRLCIGAFYRTTHPILAQEDPECLIFPGLGRFLEVSVASRFCEGEQQRNHVLACGVPWAVVQGWGDAAA